MYYYTIAVYLCEILVYIVYFSKLFYFFIRDFSFYETILTSRSNKIVM